MESKKALEEDFQLLCEAKTELEERDWCQGAEVDELTGQVCLIGSHYAARGLVRNEGDDESPMWTSEGLVHTPEARRFVELLGFMDVNDLVLWNDAGGRSKEEVLALFEESMSAIADRAKEAELD